MNKHLRIAIDGGAATGKSTVSKLVANKLGIRYINTGQMYRLFALIALENNLLDNESELEKLLNNYIFSFDENGLITCEGLEIDYDRLNSKEVSIIASKVSLIPSIRKIATLKQIKIGKEEGVLMEGRDIGTIIMPDATHKFFITVRPEVAAQRRVKHHESMGESVVYEDILKDIIERNERDTNRGIAPLKPAIDSKVIDSSDKTVEEVAMRIVGEING